MTPSETLFDAGEVQLHVTSYAAGSTDAAATPVVLVHGATSSSSTWYAVAPALAARRPVYALDLRGHGRSSYAAEGEAGYHLDSFGADVLACLRGVVGRPAVLLGHSLGGLAVLSAAALDVDGLVRAVIAEDPPLPVFRADGQPDVTGAISFFHVLARLKQSTPHIDGLRAAVVQMMPGLPDFAIQAIADDIHHVDPALLRVVGGWAVLSKGVDPAVLFSAIRCPVLLMQADPAAGGMLPERDLRTAQEYIARLSVRCFPGVSHGIHDNPGPFLAAVEEFLTTLV